MSRVESVERGAERVPVVKRFGDLSHQAGLGGMWLLLAYLLALLVIASRCPSLFTHPQFYAEDGPVFFAPAYNLGWLHSLGMLDTSYLTIPQRFAAGAALLVPFQWAPLVMTVIGLLVQALPVPLLLSSRLRGWAPLPVRMAFAAAYVGIPDCREVHVVCTNSQWHLALLLGMLVFAATPESVAGKIFDVVMVSLAVLTGPFALLMVPLAAIFWWVRRQRWAAVLLGIVTVGSAVQLFMIVRHSTERPHAPLGATPALFARLLGGNAFVGALLGSRHFGLKLPLAISVCMLVIGITLCVYCAKSLRAEARLFIVYCFLIYAAGMRNPMMPNNLPSWPILLGIPSQRYVFFPTLALLFSVLWCAGYARQRAIRGTAMALTLVLCVGICLDWKIPPQQIVDSSKQVAAFEAAKPGERVVIPIYPPGWNMTLIKRQ